MLLGINILETNILLGRVLFGDLKPPSLLDMDLLGTFFPHLKRNLHHNRQDLFKTHILPDRGLLKIYIPLERKPPGTKRWIATGHVVR